MVQVRCWPLPAYGLVDCSEGRVCKECSGSVWWLGAMRGRVASSSRRQASMMALATVSNRCRFRHAFCRLPSKVSIKALSIGLPGLEKSIRVPWWQAQGSTRWPGHARAVVSEQVLRRTSLRDKAVQDLHHILPSQPLACLDRQALTAEHVDHRQGAGLLSVAALVGHDVQAPFERLRTCLALRCTSILRSRAAGASHGVDLLRLLLSRAGRSALPSGCGHFGHRAATFPENVISRHLRAISRGYFWN